MAVYILRRLLQTLVLLFLVSVVVFVMLRLIPGDPAQVLLGDRATKQELAQARAQWGLDQPLPVQYASFLSNALQGNLGRSLTWSTPATQVVASRLPATFQLALCAMLLAVIIAFPLGILSATYPYSLVDRFSTSLSILLQS